MLVFSKFKVFLFLLNGFFSDFFLWVFFYQPFFLETIRTKPFLSQIDCLSGLHTNNETIQFHTRLHHKQSLGKRLALYIGKIVCLG